MEEIKAYRTTDGSLFEEIETAKLHQKHLDFNKSLEDFVDRYYIKDMDRDDTVDLSDIFIKNFNLKLQGIQTMTKIHNWEELSKVKRNGNMFIRVYLNDYWGEICSQNDDDDYYYLSTHTFYSKDNVKYANKILQKCGFDIELVSRDD